MLPNVGVLVQLLDWVFNSCLMVLTNLKTLFVAVCAFEYGEEAEAALLRLLGFNLPITVGNESLE